MENHLYGKRGGFILGYSLELPEKYSLGEADYDALNDYWSKALADLPTGSVFFKQDIFKESEYQTEDFPNRNFLEKSTKKYFKGIDYLSHQTNLFFLLPNKSIEIKKIKNPIRPPQVKEFLEFDEKIKNFITSVNQSINYLNGLKISGGNQLKIQPLQREYMLKYYDYINSGLNENYDVDIKNEWNYLRVGNQYASILKFPDETKFPEKLLSCRIDSEFSNDKSKFYKNYGDNFGFDLNFTHIYNQIVVIDDNKYHYEKARKNHQNLTVFRAFDNQNKHFAKETEKMLDEMAKHTDTERIVRAHNNIIVFAESENQLEKRIDLLSEKFKDIDIKPERAFGNNLMALYEYSFPLNADMFVDEYFYVANLEMFASFMILTGKYNDDREGLRLNSRLGGMIPVKVDVWDEGRKYVNARNFFILCPTGGGKSFSANHMISHNYSDGAKQVIIDLGGSYRKLASLFPNDIAYITYNEGDKLGVNPFELKEGEELTTTKIDELVEFVGVHFKRDSFLSEKERAVLRKIIEFYYKNIKENHSLPDFVKRFIQSKEEIVEHLEIKSEFFNVDEFILLMSEFIGNGAFASLYDESKEDFGADLYNKKIVVFELDKIRGHKLLLSIMLQLISTTIEKMIWSDKATRGVILFDEVAEQLQWDGMLRRIQWFYQAIRKQNGSIGIILQSVSQLPENELSKSIIENTQILYVLGSKDYKAIQNRFGLSDHAYYQMTSLRSDFHAERKYSEFFLLRGEKHQVYRLEVPKEVFWAYQTDGAMNDMLINIYGETQNMEKAIHLMIENQSRFEELKDLLKRGQTDKEEIRKEINNIIKNYEYEK